MRDFVDIYTKPDVENTIFFVEPDGKHYSYNLEHLANIYEDFAKEAYRYKDPFVLKRSVYYTMRPTAVEVDFIRWHNDWCDVPIGGFYYDYESNFVPYLEEIES